MDTNLSDQKPPVGSSDDSAQPAPVSDKPVDSPPPSTLPDTELPDIESPATPSEGDSQENPEEIPVKKKDVNFLSKALLVFGPLIMVGLFAVAFYNLIKRPVKIPVQAPTRAVKPESKDVAKQILLNVPKNPDQVSAKCLSTGEVLTSGQPTTCSDPQFSWTGEEPRVPGTNIVGFYVYFGTNGDDSPITPSDPPSKRKKVIRPFYDGHFQEENVFSPTDMEKGTTYYLAVAAKSDSPNPLWQVGFDVVDIEKLEAQVAKVLFVYGYQ